MQRLPIDSVEFPLYIVSGKDIDCSFSGIENGIIDSLSQEEFLERYNDEQEFGSLTDFGDTIEYKTVVLYDERLTDEEIHLLSFEVSLLDLKGKLILNSKNDKSINLNSIPQGTYLLEIKDLNTG